LVRPGDRRWGAPTRAQSEKKATLVREFGISRETVYQYLAAAAL